MENNIICYDDIGYVGANKVIANITKIYWFSDMQTKVKNYIKNCLKLNIPHRMDDQKGIYSVFRRESYRFKPIT